MTESEFNELADDVFERVQQAIDDSGADIECNMNGSVLELEFEDGSKIIVNRHLPTREIWIAAKSGGFHYAREQDEWISNRDGSELYAKLQELISLGAGVNLIF